MKWSFQLELTYAIFFKPSEQTSFHFHFKIAPTLYLELKQRTKDPDYLKTSHSVICVQYKKCLGLGKLHKYYSKAQPINLRKKHPSRF